MGTISRQAIYGATRDQPGTISEVGGQSQERLDQSAQGAAVAAPAGAADAASGGAAAMNWIAVAVVLVLIRVVWELSGGD